MIQGWSATFFDDLIVFLARKAGAGPGSNPWGKGGTNIDKRMRTVYFSHFYNMKLEDIIKLVEEWTDGYGEHIEEVYTIGGFGEQKRGAARFKLGEGMWEYMVANKGKLKHTVGDQIIFANTDSLHDPDPGKSKAVKKVVRLLIEKHGGDGPTVKKQMQTNYNKGLVGWKGEVVAEWNEETREMKLMGEVAAWQGEYRKMMGEE